jgi:exoribonuclease R
MIKIIYEQIQAMDSITFDELFQKNSSDISTKQELGTILRTLENEKKIFQYSNNYYDLEKFTDIDGYVQWNLTGFCWLSDTNSMNEYGISFNSNDNLLPIYNKKEALYGTYINGKKITIDDKEFVFITTSKPTQDIKLIATYQKVRNEWIILNSGTNFNFRNSLENINNGQVAIFNSNEHKLIELIGNINEFGIESKIITILANIKDAKKSTDFPIPEKDIIKLEQPFYTIDSLNTKDIDDAIYIEENQHGFHLIVGIADVSSYVLPNDEQDLQAQQSCSSMYLPHDTIHMLDRELAENHCSLTPGVYKRTMICDMQFDTSGVMLNKKFYCADIISHARLTYSDVDKIIDNINPQESLLYKEGKIQKLNTYNEDSKIFNSLKTLQKFSETQKRIEEQNYFTIEQTEYHLGENGKIEYLYIKHESTASQKMVESAMLSANIAAAKFLNEEYSNFGLFRNQIEPEPNEFPKSAFYDTNNKGHWGLNTEHYTHFTSPIRRYCDLLVHRLIKNVILKDQSTYTSEELQTIVEQINLQQYKSKQFNIKAKNLLIPQYVEQLLTTNEFDEKLTIVDFSDKGIVCRNRQLIEIFIPSFKLEKDITRALEKYLPNENNQLTVEDKKEAIKQLNQEWMLFTKISNFLWTDERKNSFYQISKKQRRPRIAN